MIGEKNLTMLIRAEIKREFANLKMTGNGGNTLITSEADIDIVTKGSHKARYNGVEINVGSTAVGGYSYIIYKNGSTYNALNENNVIDFSGTDAYTVIQVTINALASGGIILIKNGTYILTNTLVLRADVLLIGESRVGTILYLGNGINKEMIVIPANADRCGLRRIKLDGNKANNSGRDVLHIYAPVWKPTLHEVSIYNASGMGIHATGSSTNQTKEMVLFDVDVLFSISDGVNFGNMGDMFAVDLYSETNGGQGISLYDSGGTYIHPHAYNNAESGIYIGAGQYQDVFYNAMAENNIKRGIYINGANNVRLHNFTVFANSHAGIGSYYGIDINNAENIILLGGNVVDPNSTPKQKGIQIAANCSYVQVIANNIGGNINPNFNNLGASDLIFENNVGWKNHNYGHSVGTGYMQSIPHGLAQTPAGVQLTNSSAGANPYEYGYADTTYIYVVAGTGLSYMWEVWF